MINPAPIASQSSLNAGDHDELEIFLEIRLIPSRMDQKLKNKREIHQFLERKLAQNRGQLRRSWEWFDGVEGAIPLGGVMAPGLAVD